MSTGTNDTTRPARKTMPIQVGGELDLAERRGERLVLVRSIPWEMVTGEAIERQSQKNHSQSVEKIAERFGYSACEAVRVISGLGWNDPKLMIPERDAHRILYAMVWLFNRGQRIAEEAAQKSPGNAVTAEVIARTIATELGEAFEALPPGPHFDPEFTQDDFLRAGIAVLALFPSG